MLFRRSKEKKPVDSINRLPALADTRANTTLPIGATDELVVSMWLAQRPPSTQEVYRRTVTDLQKFTGQTPLRELNLLQLQQFASSLIDQAHATQARKISAVKSLLSFCHKAGYTVVNVGAALRTPKVENRLAERIMSEAQMQRILALETNARNHALLRLLYNAGLRVSEVCALTWNDLQERAEGGQIRAYGKGEKERYILISAETYQELHALRQNALDFAPIFQSRKTTQGSSLTRGQVNRIIEVAAIRARVAIYEERNSQGQLVTRSRVSPHWFRHAHGSHSLDRGAPVTLVRDTLGHASIATTNKYSHARPGESSGAYLPI